MPRPEAKGKPKAEAKVGSTHGESYRCDCSGAFRPDERQRPRDNLPVLVVPLFHVGVEIDWLKYHRFCGFPIYDQPPHLDPSLPWLASLS